MKTAGSWSAAGQGDIERFLRELRFEFCRRNSVALVGKRFLDLLLRRIEARAHRGPLGRRKLAETFLQIRKSAGLAEETRFGLFKLRCIGDTCKQQDRILND